MLDLSEDAEFVKFGFQRELLLRCSDVSELEGRVLCAKLLNALKNLVLRDVK